MNVRQNSADERNSVLCSYKCENRVHMITLQGCSEGYTIRVISTGPTGSCLTSLKLKHRGKWTPFVTIHVVRRKASVVHSANHKSRMSTFDVEEHSQPLCCTSR